VHQSLTLTSETKEMLQAILARFDSFEGPAISEPEVGGGGIAYNLGCGGNCKGSCHGNCQGDCSGGCDGDCKGDCGGDCKGYCSDGCTCSVMK
jgi:hypothetical protein